MLIYPLIGTVTEFLEICSGRPIGSVHDVEQYRVQYRDTASLRWMSRPPLHHLGTVNQPAWVRNGIEPRRADEGRTTT